MRKCNLLVLLDVRDFWLVLIDIGAQSGKLDTIRELNQASGVRKGSVHN